MAHTLTLSIPTREPGKVHAAMLPTLDAVPVHDMNASMEMLDGDRELLQELIELFTENTKKTLVTLEEATRKNDAQGVGHAAHSVKGSAANLCAERLRVLAADLEEAARDGRQEVFEAFLTALNHEFENFVAATGTS